MTHPHCVSKGTFGQISDPNIYFSIKTFTLKHLLSQPITFYLINEKIIKTKKEPPLI